MHQNEGSAQKPYDRQKGEDIAGEKSIVIYGMRFGVDEIIGAFFPGVRLAPKRCESFHIACLPMPHARLTFCNCLRREYSSLSLAHLT